MNVLKRISGLLLLLGGVCLAVPGQGQEKVYFTETFPNGRLGDNWNREESTTITAASGPVYMVDMGSYMAGGWIYDPTGSIILASGRAVATTPLDGQYLLVSAPFQLDTADYINMLTLDYFYTATAVVAGDVRNFGLMARDTADVVWDTVYTMFAATDSLNDGLEGSIGMTLPETYRGKVVELALYFTNETDDADNSFGMFISNLKFAAYDETTVFEMSAPESDLAYGNPFEFVVNVTNQGTVPIESMEFSYSFGEGEAKTLTVDSLSIEPLVAEPVSLPLDMEGLEAGSVAMLTLNCVGANGIELSDPESLTWRFTYVNEEGVVPFMPLIEHFTSSTCGPCGQLATILNPIYARLKEEGKVNIIKYQMNFPSPGDPYYIADNGTRASYYGVRGVPYFMYNGEVNIPSTTGVGNDVQAVVASDEGRMSGVSIECEELKVDTVNERLSTRIAVRAAYDIRTAKFFATLIEGTTTRNRRNNGETEFHYVTMSHLAGPRGEDARYTAGETVEYEYNIDLSGTHIEEMTDLELVCFVQDPDAGDVFQSAGFADVVYGEVEEEQEPDPQANEKDMLPEVRLYPNPAKDNVMLSGLDNAEIRIFDMAGRLVRQYESLSGLTELSVSDLHAGVYMLQIEQAGKTAVRRLSIAR